MRTVLLASGDAGLRQRLKAVLTGLRWEVREAAGGAEAMAFLEESKPEAMIMDSWLPDLEANGFAEQIRKLYPAMDLLRVDGPEQGDVRSPRRNELLYALREVQGAPIPINDGVESRRELAMAGVYGEGHARERVLEMPRPPLALLPKREEGTVLVESRTVRDGSREIAGSGVAVVPHAGIPELVGSSAAMRELASLIRMVAARSTTVLIEGETGTGKEVVARALHRLSLRAEKTFAVLNCAAIPEALLEAELFGHTRGAFTGAVHSRTGRIEAADGGTLFLDEIGEMPMALQSKMLRFLECGELQRVGDNETVRVNVRVIAATHQPLVERATEKRFRLDLYHRLAVFPIEVPPLRARREDLPVLIEHFLAMFGVEAPRKQLSEAAAVKLYEYDWPGNVRELMHVLERGAILCGERPEIGVEEIRFRRVNRG